ncbi:hypothetical protein AK812_SmicGene28607 [Symbiodinium microadriaticum]|uniref:RNase H type-1 domain-containing protein n=1 Tax=Symbiodinium microadriaticum TaxID=2951 RepID=A0A1Q9D417_SYMMI|nr:hypothetical protein AK812_SmicGene28607 [Symbiodinium microadriaticum]
MVAWIAGPKEVFASGDKTHFQEAAEVLRNFRLLRLCYKMMLRQTFRPETALTLSGSAESCDVQTKITLRRISSVRRRSGKMQQTNTLVAVLAFLAQGAVGIVANSQALGVRNLPQGKNGLPNSEGSTPLPAVRLNLDAACAPNLAASVNSAASANSDAVRRPHTPLTTKHEPVPNPTATFDLTIDDDDADLEGNGDDCTTKDSPKSDRPPPALTSDELDSANAERPPTVRAPPQPAAGVGMYPLPCEAPPWIRDLHAGIMGLHNKAVTNPLAPPEAALVAGTNPAVILISLLAAGLTQKEPTHNKRVIEKLKVMKFTSGVQGSTGLPRGTLVQSWLNSGKSIAPITIDYLRYFDVLTFAIDTPEILDKIRQRRLLSGREARDLGKEIVRLRAVAKNLWLTEILDRSANGDFKAISYFRRRQAVLSSHQNYLVSAGGKDQAISDLKKHFRLKWCEPNVSTVSALDILHSPPRSLPSPRLITEEEVCEVLATCKSGKSCGDDGISYEFLQKIFTLLYADDLLFTMLPGKEFMPSPSLRIGVTRGAWPDSCRLLQLMWTRFRPLGAPPLWDDAATDRKLWKAFVADWLADRKLQPHLYYPDLHHVDLHGRCLLQIGSTFRLLPMRHEPVESPYPSPYQFLPEPVDDDDLCCLQVCSDGSSRNRTGALGVAILPPYGDVAQCVVCAGRVHDDCTNIRAEVLAAVRAMKLILELRRYLDPALPIRYMTDSAFVLQILSEALSWALYFQEFFGNRTVQTAVLCLLAPLLVVLAKHAFKIVVRVCLAAHGWWMAPPRWTLQLGALHLKLQEEYAARFDKLESLVSLRLQEMEERQTAGQVQSTTRQAAEMADSFDKIHQAVKQGAQKVSLEDAQLKQLQDLLSNEVVATKKAMTKQESLLESLLKQCKVLETTQDGLLAQGRETFQELQASSKHTLEKITEKLVALDKLVDVISQAIQKVSNETHAGFVRADQKADKNASTWWSEHGSLKAMLSSIVPMVREVRPAVCEGLPKGIAEVLHETNGVRGRVDELPVDRAMQGLSEIIRVTSESKDSLDQIWSWMSDLSRQILEVSSLVQETESKVLDRLPKIPARKPPTQTGATRSAAQTEQPTAQGPETIRLQESIPASSTQPIFVAASNPMPQPMPQLLLAPQGTETPFVLTPQQAAVIRSAFR